MTSDMGRESDMELYAIAEALSVVLEIKNGSTPMTASFHMGVSGDINVDVYPDSDNTDHFYAFSAYPALSDYWMEEHVWHLPDNDDEPEDHRVLSKQEYKSFAEMVQAIREVKYEPYNIQTHRRRRSISRTPTV